MLITPHIIEKFRNNPLGYLEAMRNQVESGDTELCFAREPLISDFPREEGMHFIYSKILELEELSTENIANSLLEYTQFMKKHNIKIIKEYDSKCSLAYSGEIPKIQVEKFETESFYGFNKFHIIDADTLSRKDDLENNIYIKPLDYTYALDSNAASFFEEYHRKHDKKYESLYKEIISSDNNIDVLPYVFEIVLNGLLKYGINYKLNKNNKNEDQQAFFQTISALHQAGLFKEKLAKVFINNIIKDVNPLIEYYGYLGYAARIFLLIMLEAKYKYGKSSNGIKDFVYSEMRRLNQPIENRYKAILYLFAEQPGHPFFEKIKDPSNVLNLEKYLNNLDNTARDIALSFSDKYFYARMNIFPFLASDDGGFIKMLQDTKPDLVFKYDNLAIPIYKKINREIEKKYIHLFETDTPQVCGFQDGTLKGQIDIYKEKHKSFVQLIAG